MGAVRRSPGTIGYATLVYARHAGMKYGSVRNRSGLFVQAGPESVRAAVSGAWRDAADGLRISLIDAPGEDSYPVCGAVWAVLYTGQPGVRGRRVADFLWWVVHDGQRFCAELSYTPLPEGLVRRLEKHLDGIKVGP